MNTKSSPARGTWIEIVIDGAFAGIVDVVPRKGDVDRNRICNRPILAPMVVPRKGDVDRNVDPKHRANIQHGRPPQGGRG